MGNELKGSRYVLPDGREFVVMQDFEVVAAARRAGIEQARRDEALRLRLERERAGLGPSRFPWPAQGDLF
jgi:hypothetical protein